jgi:broad specificity phosphatase PhoE
VIEELILVRHGETVSNAAGIAQGWGDSALSARGAGQVSRIGERLKRHEPDAIFSSPIGRALATAQAISDILGLEVTTLEGLREMSYGSWENRAFLDVRREEKEAYERWISDPDAASPGGESHTQVRRRLQETIESLSGVRRPILVSHGTAIRIAVTALLNLPVMASMHFAQDNAAVNIFLRRPGRWVLKVWNDTTHCWDS